MSGGATDAAARVAWIEHRGRRILRVDLRDLDRDGLLTAGERYGELLRAQPADSVRMLVLHGSFEFHPDVMTRNRGVMMEVSSKVQRSALVGPEGMMKVAIERYFEAASMLGQDVSQRGRGYPEAAEAAALEWLAEG